MIMSAFQQRQENQFSSRAHPQGQCPILGREDDRQLIRAILEELRAHSIDPKEHEDHHAYIRSQIEKDKERTRLYRSITDEIIRKGVIAVCTIVAAAAIFGMQRAFDIIKW